MAWWIIHHDDLSCRGAQGRPTGSPLVSKPQIFHQIVDSALKFHHQRLFFTTAIAVTRDLPAEVAYLEAYDRFAERVQQIVDMPQALIDLLHHFLRQNGGSLSQRARSTEFQRLTAEEVSRIEQLFDETAVGGEERVRDG